jgi:hypothetical protein
MIVYIALADFVEINESPTNEWIQGDARGVLEKYAKNRNLDPFLAVTWYNITSAEIYQDVVCKAKKKRYRRYL